MKRPGGVRAKEKGRSGVEKRRLTLDLQLPKRPYRIGLGLQVRDICSTQGAYI